MSEKLTKVLDEIASWNLLEVKEFIAMFEEKFDVEAQAAVAVAAPAAGGGDGGEPAEEQTEFDVELSDIGGQKIQVIKAVREATGLGLADAKKLVEGAPCKVKEGLPKAEAEDLVKKLEDAGAKAAVK